MPKIKSARKSDIWQDRENNRRPTPERREKSGAWRLADAEDAGTSYAMDEGAFPFALLYRQGDIEPEQWDAATRYVELARLVRGSPSQRSCLDFSPIGHDEGDGSPEIEADWKDIGEKLGYMARQLIDEAVYQQGGISDLVALKRACDVCVKHWGIKR